MLLSVKSRGKAANLFNFVIVLFAADFRKKPLSHRPRYICQLVEKGPSYADNVIFHAFLSLLACYQFALVWLSGQDILKGEEPLKSNKNARTSSKIKILVS